MRPPTRKILSSAFHSFARPQNNAGQRRVARRLLWGLASAAVIAGQAYFSDDYRMIAHLDVNTTLRPSTRASPKPPPGSNAPTSPYTSLSQDQKTRIMLLEPGRGQDALRCDLLPISSFTQVPYEALSYQWGDTTDKSCNLDCCGANKKISATLDAALRRLRNKSGIRAIWVDAVCINQDDLAERASQVRVMRDIYANATRVVVWLGKAEARDASALDEIGRINEAQRQPVLLMNGFGSSPARAPKSKGILSRSEFYTTAPKLQDAQYEHIVELLCRGYFHRAWIVQELVMAKDAVVLYGEGDKHISWDVLAKVVLDKLDRVVPQDVLDRPKVQKSRRNIESIEIARLDRLRSEGSPLFDILFDTAQTQCTDARDKIFAFLGLAQDWLQDSSGIEPNYEVDVATLFKKVATWDHQTSGTLRMLSCCSGPWDKERQNEALDLLGDTSPQARNKLASLRLPSWVPDWTRMGSSTPFALYDACIPFSAGSAKPVGCSAQGDVLKVRGMVVDKVDDIVKSTPTFVKTTGFYSLRGDFIDDVDNVRIWVEECARIAGGGGLLTEDRFDSFWKAMTCELTERAEPAPEEYPELFRKYLRHIDQAPRMFRRILATAQQNKTHWPGVTLEGTARGDFEGLEAIEATLDRWTKGRRFFATESGLLGQAPEKARTGDLVCVLHGSKVPFVLRPAGSGYELVGECYVDGIMKGEAMRNAAKEEVLHLGPWLGMNGTPVPKL